jgi:hypothetical protein
MGLRYKVMYLYISILVILAAVVLNIGEKSSDTKDFSFTFAHYGICAVVGGN